ncbi:MAG TPA: benzoylformate decarboxylase [Solirubrobacterales bacterium]|nr:benzoylformate decarboxylase [Solirubrobacterales bacterium]
MAPSVRDASYELLREHGLTTVFGNPGSTELPFLSAFPPDFRYVLGLQEAIVVGMADGYAQASGRPTLVNLHTAPGVGNAMGALFNARENKSPLVVTAGQQVRAMMTIEALLTNRDATTLPRPVTKWSYEPPRPQDVPAALARAFHVSATSPRGPVFVSIPMDDWSAEADEQVSRPVTGRRVDGRTAPDPAALAELARRLGAASNPVLVAGPDIDASGAWDTAVALAERCRLPVWSTPASGSGRLGFPENHPQFQGTLPPAIAPVAQTLEGHDLVLVAGAAVFTYYPYIAGPFLPDGAALVQLTSDPDEAARAPVGDAILGDVALALSGLLEQVPAADRPAPPSRPDPEPPPDSDPITATAAAAALAEVFPDNGIIVNEAPSSVLAFRNQVRLGRSGSYFFGAGGGLGYGLPAAIGVQLAQPERPVVGVIGDGSMQYAIAALWSAVAYEVPLTVLVLRNEEYAILKWFAEFEGEMGAPGLDVAGLDSVAIASGYGMRARRVEGSGELRSALADAISSGTPELIEVRIAPGMSLG